MHLDVKDAAEFQTMLGALADDLVDANIHLRLYLDLNAALPEFSQEFNEASTFWFLTFRAHLDAAVIRVCRSYDTEKKALNLRNLLDTISENVAWFDEAQFRERLQGNPFIDSLADSARRPDAKRLQEDLTFVKEDIRVKTLVVWRHNAYAHRSVTHALAPLEFESGTHC